MTELAAFNANKQRNSILSQRFRYQILATISVHIITMSHGIGIGWMSPSMPLLLSNKTPLDAPITIEQASWVGSLIGLGSALGNILFGILLDRIGRKWCMNLIAIPHMLFWILVYTAQNVDYLYAGRFLAGVTGGGSYVVLPIFISEIADTSIRGALTSMSMTYIGFGILLGLISATYLSYHLMPCIIIALPLIYFCAIARLKETPQYLLRRGNVLEAEKSYNFYKNIPSTDTAAAIEATQQDPTNKAEFETFKAQILKVGATEAVTIADFFKKDVMKTFAIILALLITNQFSGSFAIYNYTSHIFAELGNSLDPNTSTIIVGSFQILGTMCTIALVDRFGRRILFLISASGMGLGMLGIGLFKQFANEAVFVEFDWVPLFLMCFVSFIASMGVIALVFVITVEVLPAKIRSIGTSICMTTLSLFVFASLKIYPVILSEWGLSISMYLSAGVCLFGLLVLGIFLPETNGKSMTH